MLRSSNIQDLDVAEAVVDPGFAFAMRSCSLLKVDPQVLHRHPVIGIRAALASLIRDGLNDSPSSPPQSRHKRLATGPLFDARPNSSNDERTNPTLGLKPRVEPCYQLTGAERFRLAILWALLRRRTAPPRLPEGS